MFRDAKTNFHLKKVPAKRHKLFVHALFLAENFLHFFIHSRTECLYILLPFISRV